MEANNELFQWKRNILLVNIYNINKTITSHIVPLNCDVRLTLMLEWLFDVSVVKPRVLRYISFITMIVCALSCVP